jgi:rubrerythrin
MEQAAIDAYSGVLRRIGDHDQRLVAAYILVDEVRHVTAWSAALGLRLY